MASDASALHRRSARARVALAGLSLVLLAATPARTPAGRDEAFERKILQELETAHPDAVVDFQAANAARDRNDFATASGLYARVQEKAPDYDHAIRRRCSCESRLDHRAPAIALCRLALSKARSPENLGALASTLIEGGRTAPPPPAADVEEAWGLVTESALLDPKSPFTQMVRCQLAVQRRDWASLDDASNRLTTLAPNEVATHQFRAIAAVTRRDLSGARESLSRAKALGLTGEGYDKLDAIIRSAKPWPLRILPIVGIVLGAWIAGFLILFAMGAVLSSVALKAAAEPPAERTGRATGMSEKLLRLYARVLWACCVYFYVSIPLLLITVIGFAGAVTWAFFALGRIPVKLLLVLALLVFSSIMAIVKALFARGRDEDPGARLDLAAEPRLRAVLDEVAARVGTRTVDSVYATPGSNVAVMERGSMLRQIGGKPERCLIVGAAALDGLEQRPFKAILAHEYGHFSNRDTDAGGLALAVRRALFTMAQHLAIAGAATWYSPAWWFVRGFHRVFLRISQGASRLQEVLADRWAAFNYGAASFEKGLSHVVGREVRFGASLTAAVREAVERKTPVPNLYSYRTEKPVDESEISAEIEKALNAEPSPYDSHPAPAHRFRWVHALDSGGAAPPTRDDSEPAWNLFADREAIERQMTDRVRGNLAMNYGVALP